MAPEKDRTVPQLLLEKLALGELDPATAATVRSRLEAQPGGLERLHELERSNAEILLTHPPRAMVPEIRRRATRSTTKSITRSTFLVLAPVALAAGVAMIVARPASTDVTPALPVLDGPEVTRTKGDTPVLRVYRHTGAGNERLHPGATVEAGDLLQLGYVSMGNGYGIVFSIDGRGAVTLHHPQRPGQAQALLKAGEVLLPLAYELDDAPGFERFFIVGSQDAPVDLDAVIAGAQALAKDPQRAQSAFLDLPDGLQQYSLTLRKAE